MSTKYLFADKERIYFTDQRKGAACLVMLAKIEEALVTLEHRSGDLRQWEHGW